MAAFFFKFVGSAGVAGFVYWWIRSNKWVLAGGACNAHDTAFVDH